MTGIKIRWNGAKAYAQRVGRTLIITCATTGAVLATVSAHAQADSPDQPGAALSVSNFFRVVDPVTIAGAAFLLGGAALVAAFTVGGGFRVAKKGYSWVMGKM